MSKIESGKAVVITSKLVYISNVLKKPTIYFFPPQLVRHLCPDSWKGDETLDELFMVAKEMNEEDLRKIILQMRAISNL